jgi:hypothetical protein
MIGALIRIGLSAAAGYAATRGSSLMGGLFRGASSMMGRAGSFAGEGPLSRLAVGAARDRGRSDRRRSRGRAGQGRGGL